MEMALAHDPNGDIVDRLSLLDNSKPMYLTLEWKVWILLIVKSITYSFNLNMKCVITFSEVLMSSVKMMTSSIMQSMYSHMSGGNS